MVVHEDPGIDGAFPLGNVLFEALQKACLILSIVEYVGFVDSPHHDMVQGAGNIQSCLAWHGVIVWDLAMAVNIIVSHVSTSPIFFSLVQSDDHNALKIHSL